MTKNEKFESALVEGIDNGSHVTGTPLTTELADAAAPGLLRNDIDSAIVKVRPMATPLDQISRMGHVRRTESLEVDYYSVDTRIDQCALSSMVADSSLDTADGHVGALMTLEAPNILEVSETFAMMKEGVVVTNGYVADKSADGLKVILPDSIPADVDDEEYTIIRMGRAATQLDVQSPQFSVLPTKSSNLCQIFKMQIEQSMVMKQSHKEIGWDFNDQQEAAVYDMRLGMEKQFLFGKKMKVYDPIKGETVTLTEGIWHQAGNQLKVSLSNFDSKALIDLLRKIFTGNCGSRRKVLIAGSELIAAINKLDAEKVITARDQVTSWGIDFSELCSKFGKLYVVFSDIFDGMGMASSGIVVDPEYIQKHVFIPFNAERIDLRGSGQRNTEAMVLTEASCLTLRYPDAHARIIGE